MIRTHGILLVVTGIAILCFFRDRLYDGLARFAAPSIEGAETLSPSDQALLNSLTFIIPTALILVGSLNLWRAAKRRKNSSLHP